MSKILEGKVFSGLGEGGYYISMPDYQSQFLDRLGYIPFAGTLNLKVNSDERDEFIKNLEPINILGFTNKTGKYGDIVCYEAEIQGIIVYIIIPQKTHYKGDTIEVISEYFLREKFDLKDGDTVIIRKGENEES